MKQAQARINPLALSSESMSHGLYFWEIVNEVTATAAATDAFVVLFLKNTSMDVSSSRTVMRYTPYQYVSGSNFSKRCDIASRTFETSRSFETARASDDLSWLAANRELRAKGVLLPRARLLLSRCAIFSIETSSSSSSHFPS